jgi:hypothetical protein
VCLDCLENRELIYSNLSFLFPEAECLVTTVSVTSETTNSNSLLPNTASNDIQQHVNSTNSGDVDNEKIIKEI